MLGWRSCLFLCTLLMSLFADEHLLFSPAHPIEDAISLIFAFPSTYKVGITSLGYQVVWATLASRTDLAVGRLFTDAQDSLPSQPELVGFSVSWELDYINILDLLDGLKVPLRSSHRSAADPIVFGGGPVLTANPEPFADFFDVILLGDGELLLTDFIDAYRSVRKGDRHTQLCHLANVPGVYVPSLYQPIYTDPNGLFSSIAPITPDIPDYVTKQTYRGNTLSTSTVVTDKAAWESIYMVEVVRSCPEMCRFCLASYLTLPFRTVSVEESLIPAIDRGLTVTDRI
ncbi:MAG: radical SAM protein, partial [Symploca sp. SIO2B6]|nr:radical SAM protein [Symploca sp. SIO2B6]